MKGHQLVGRGEEALIGVKYLVEKVNALRVPPEEPRGESERVARANLAVVRDVGLEAKRGHVTLRPMLLGETEVADTRVGGEVEDDLAAAPVLVPSVVNPLWTDHVAVGVERCRNLLETRF